MSHSGEQRLQELHQRLANLCKKEKEQGSEVWLVLFTLLISVVGMVLGIGGAAEGRPELSVFGAMLFLSVIIGLAVSTVNDWLRQIYQLHLEEAIERESKKE